MTNILSWQILKGREDYSIYFGALLAIEVDGSVHLDATQNERDHERTRIMGRWDIEVLRVTNDEVEQHIGTVIEKIQEHLKRRNKVK